ncbi:hypothetical protein PAMP_000692 [Pampus punctatissimus]
MRAKASDMHSKDCVKVAVRVRPFNKASRVIEEFVSVAVMRNGCQYRQVQTEKYNQAVTVKREKDAGSRCIISMVSSSITIQDPRDSQSRRSFCFDYAYWSHSSFTQDHSGLYLPEEPGGRYADQGYNATLLAYGQTGSGKSYSMVFFSMLEIYNEQVVDLLSRASRTPGGLRVREEQQRGFYVEGLRTVPCDSAPQVEQLMEQGTRTRTTAATHMNANSSRSHMLIILQLKQISLEILPAFVVDIVVNSSQIFSKESITKQSNINLVDLAGSERQRSSGSEADRLKEGTAINLSLTTLGNVISTLADVAGGKKVVHIPYRDSVLTKLLQSALGGNSRTVMVTHTLILTYCSTVFVQNPLKHEFIFKIATLSPADICYEESLSTLRYAERAKRIQNRAVVNESPTERLVKELKAENARLLQRLSRLGQEGRRTNDETSEWDIGLCDSSPRSISIKGLGIQERHAVFRNEQRRVTLTTLAGSKVIVNGNSVSQTTELQHLDRLILGSNCTYLFIGFPSERGGDDWSRYDYDYFQSELAAAEGIHLGESSAESSQTDPSLLAVFYDYIKLMPMVAEVNQMSQELKKGVEFKLEIKNLALSDSKGHDLEKEINIRVTSMESKQVWIWSKAKFVNRKFLMEDVYQQHQAEQRGENRVDSAELSCSLRALQQDLEELKRTNASLKKENQSLREQLNTARNGGESVRGRVRPSCDAEFARALKVFYHSMTSVRGQLQRLRRHRPSEESDLLGLRFFVDEQSRLLRDFSEQLEQSVSTLKQDVAAIVRRKRERSGIWS